jgi:hypothetical protein
MSRIAAIAAYLTLIALPGMSADAQTASVPDAQPLPMQRTAPPVIRCTHQDNGSRFRQPCRVRPAAESTHLGHDITRPELECVLSGVCGVVDRTRVNG